MRVNNQELFIAEIFDKWKKGKLSCTEAVNTIKGIDGILQGNSRPKVYFSKIAYDKTYALVEQCKMEIAWDYFVRRDKEDPLKFYVDDVIVYPQYVSGAAVNTDDTEYNNYLNSLNNEQFNSRRGQGHSHVNFSVTPSSTDLQHRIDSVRNIPDFFLFFIFNKKGDTECQITDIEGGIIYQDKDIDLVFPKEPQVEWAIEQIKEKVKVRTVNNFRNGNAYHPEWEKEKTQVEKKGSEDIKKIEDKKDDTDEYECYKLNKQTLPKYDKSKLSSEARKEFFQSLTGKSIKEINKIYGEEY